MKNQNAGCLFNGEAVLSEIRAGKIPEDGERLLKVSRELKTAENSRELWEFLPFRMACETLYGKKEGYREILEEIKRIKDRDYDRIIQGFCAGKPEESMEAAYFLAACVDTAEFISMEIYEQYRELIDLIRGTVRFLAENCWRTDSMVGMDGKTAGLLADSVLKACRLKMLSEEKYEMDGWALLAQSRANTPEGKENFK